MPEQTVQTQIRLLLEEQSDQGLHCLPFRLHSLDSEPHSSNFRVITTNVLGVRIFRKFTICGFTIQCSKKILHARRMANSGDPDQTVWGTIVVIVIKFKQTPMCLKGADRMANCVDTDQEESDLG